MMQVVRKNLTLVFVNIAGNACTAGISAIRMQHVICVVDAEASR
jgi:hypothetical protein